MNIAEIVENSDAMQLFSRYIETMNYGVLVRAQSVVVYLHKKMLVYSKLGFKLFQYFCAVKIKYGYARFFSLTTSSMHMLLTCFKRVYVWLYRARINGEISIMIRLEYAFRRYRNNSFPLMHQLNTMYSLYGTFSPRILRIVRINGLLSIIC